MHVYVDQLEHFECAVCNGRIDCTDKTPFTETTCPGCASKVTVPGLFGHYILLKRLGEGGTGPVYRAKDTKLNRVVAIKILHKVLSLNPELVEFFKHQARSASSLSHSNVMKIFELGRHAEQHYITMELIDGQNLRELLYSDTVSEEEVLHIGLGISQGLEAAFERSLIHGDVRPKNIFINHEGIPKIGDFGLARSISKGSSRPFSWVSPYYTAPERLESGEDTIFSDMYGLGATLYQALVGRPPFDDPDTDKVLQLKATFDVPDVREARPDIRPQTAAVINRLLAREPGRRYASYGDLIEAFRDALRTEESNPESLDSTAPISPSSTMPMTAVPDEEAKAGRGAWRWLAGAAVILIAGGLAYHFSNRASSSSQTAPAPDPAPLASTGQGGSTDLDLAGEDSPAPFPSPVPTNVVAVTNVAALPVPVPVAVVEPVTVVPAVPEPTPTPPVPEPANAVASPAVAGPSLWLKAGSRRADGWADASGAGQNAAPLAEGGAPGLLRFPGTDAPSYSVLLAFRNSGTPSKAGAAFKCLLAAGTPDRKDSRLSVFADRDFPSQLGYAVGGQARPDAFEMSGEGVHAFALVANLEGTSLRVRAWLDGKEGPSCTVDNPSFPPEAAWFLGGLPGLDSTFPGEMIEILVYGRALGAEETAAALADLVKRNPAP